MTLRNLLRFRSLVGATVATRWDRVLQAHRLADRLDGMVARAFADGDVETIPNGLVKPADIRAWLLKERVRLVVHVSPAFEAEVKNRAAAAGLAEGDWLEDLYGRMDGDQLDGPRKPAADGIEHKIKLIREGVGVEYVRNLVESLGVPKQDLLAALNISQAELDRTTNSTLLFSPSDGERVLGLIKLVDLVGAMVRESGDEIGFDPAKWVGRWLTRPSHALGGNKPISYLDTIEGQNLLFSLLRRQQSGAYA